MEADRNRGSSKSTGTDQLTEEDEKVERFYDLIRNYKEARDRQRIIVQRLADAEGNDDHEERKKKKLKLGDRDRPSWIPVFQPEDFTENAPAECRRPPPASDCRESNGNLNPNLPPPASDCGERNGNLNPNLPPATGDVDGGGLDLQLRL